MRLNKLDLNLLVVLDALLREKHITHAAAKLHLSQSATSGALRRLRDYFEDPLLVRAGTKMDLTPLAMGLVEPVRRILQDIQTTMEVRPEFDPSQSTRSFRFMMSDYVSMVFAPELVKRIAEQAPGICIEVKNPKLFPEEELAQGLIDFIITPIEWSGEMKGCDHEVLIEDGLVAVGCEHNEILAEGLDLEGFVGSDLVMVSLADNREPLVNKVLRERYQMALRLNIVTAYFGVIPYYLMGTQRICPMHTHLAKTWAQTYPLRYVPLPFDLPGFQWDIFWHRSRQFDPGVQWMLELCKDIGKKQFQFA